MKQPVKVYAIFRWDSDSDSSELEFLCASEIMARRVLEQIKIREGVKVSTLRTAWPLRPRVRISKLKRSTYGRKARE